MDRRSLLTNGAAAAFGALALTAVTSGNAEAAAADWYGGRGLHPDPASTPVPNPPFPHGLNRAERHELETLDTLDFDVFTNQKWNRLKESHAQNIRVHWPDGHYTDGIDKHIEDLKGLFAWAPDTRIHSHYLRLATDELSAVAGVMQGTFTRPMPDGNGGFIQPTGKKYSINMATIGIWNKRGTMDEEFLFWDNKTFFGQIGLG
ncbi:ester cyclase [Actinocrispum sp. NPDC049592]|uniref:ester cyclase n=1 Tax=Actinocrispum sp. NPDC049592 TaxID=3154835 RepID=UPI003421F89A